ALEKAASQEVARDPAPVICARTPIADGIELHLQDVGRFRDHVLLPWLSCQEALAGACPRRRSSHAAEADPGARNVAGSPVESDVEGTANARYVLIEALADLVDPEEAARTRSWNQDRFQKFRTTPVLAAIFDEIILERDLAGLRSALQAQ